MKVHWSFLVCQKKEKSHFINKMRPAVGMTRFELATP